MFRKIVGYTIAFSPLIAAFVAMGIIYGLINILLILAGVSLGVFLMLLGVCIVNDDWPWSNM